MSESKKQVITYEIDMTCDICGKGVMRPTGEERLFCLNSHQHRCTNCGNEEDYSCIYPHLQYEYVTEDEKIDVSSYKVRRRGKDSYNSGNKNRERS